MSEIAFLSMDNLVGFVSYDHLAVPPLRALNHRVQIVSWRQRIDWNQFDMVIIRTTWDYQNDLEAFLQVLKEINNSTAMLQNSFELVKWNVEKNYLQEMEEKGNPIVPSLWQNGSLKKSDLGSYFDKFHTGEIIIKPTVSANADHTYWLKKEAVDRPIGFLEKTFERRPFIVQPFMSNIVNEGEYSLFYFNGKYSHCILKKPKKNDFRVQEEHGGIIEAVKPEEKLLRKGEKAIRSLTETPLYARVDFVRDEHELFRIMEIELIEPSLYFSYDPESPQRFSQAIDYLLMKNKKKTDDYPG